MSMLRPPGLGPIIGHTTDRSCRLWIQAGKLEDEGPMSPLSANRRTIGVIGVLSEKPDDKAPPKAPIEIVKAYYFRLHREFDRTGTFELGVDVALGLHESDGVPKAQQDKPYELKPNTDYTVRMATLSLDDPLEDEDSLTDAQLRDRLPDIDKIAPLLLKLREKECQVTFWTFPDASKRLDSLSFLLGSCRYPGLLWKIKEADRVFGPMKSHLASEAGKPDARFTLMAGDQIYADTLNRFVPIGLADTYEEFQERYQTAFGSRNMSTLLKTAPTYMILDDHEIEDNWSQDRLSDNAKHRLFNLAVGAYMSYQWSHGPRTYGRLLYYQFECGGYPFFVLDTRTQRFKDDKVGLDDNHLLGRPPIDRANPGQLAQFLTWLSEQQKTRKNVPKFVVSSSVFAPNDMSERTHDDKNPGADIMTANRERRDKSDSWPAYPCTRKAILEHIVKEGIQNVVFLTGDIHCGNIARINITVGEKDSGICAYDITSSAFYWPFPFADGDPNNYVHDSTLPDQLDPFAFDGGVMNYRAWAFTQEDNFARIDIDTAKNQLVVRYFDREGNKIEVLDANDKPVTENILPLA
jgi:alkaline phosphatase D